MTEQTILEHRLGDRADIERHELPRAATEVVQSFCDEFLASAPWTQNQDGETRPRELSNHSAQVMHDSRVTDEAMLE
jgi:hypothetical protein